MVSWIKSVGRVEVDKGKDRVAVALPIDFVWYYKWFIERKYGFCIDQPTFGAHITLGYKKLHPKLNFEIAKQYQGKRIEFEYSNNIVVGGQAKGFHNFWLHVRSEELDKIRRHIRAFDNKDFQGVHITIGNTKVCKRPFWRPMIEIKK